MSDDEPVFRGIDGNEVEEFIRQVTKRGFELGNLRDNTWMAGYVSTCLMGTALRWYEEQPEDVQTDWTLLRRALLRDWPAVDDGNDQPTSEFQHPTALPPLTVIVPLTTGSFDRPCRIKVVCSTDGPGAYVSRVPYGASWKVQSSRVASQCFGCLRVTNDASDALLIEFETLGSGRRIKLQNGLMTHQELGVIFQSSWTHAYRYGLLVSVDELDAEVYQEGNYGTIQWSIGDHRNEIPFSVKDSNNTAYDLRASPCKSEGGIELLMLWPEDTREVPEDEWLGPKVMLQFEPVETLG